jgi:hypothetical protein
MVLRYQNWQDKSNRDLTLFIVSDVDLPKQLPHTVGNLPPPKGHTPGNWRRVVRDGLGARSILRRLPKTHGTASPTLEHLVSVDPPEWRKLVSLLFRVLHDALFEEQMVGTSATAVAVAPNNIVGVHDRVIATL